MGFYGDLYTNLTTFFHNLKMKGTADAAVTFPEDESILRENTIQAAPEKVYDSFSMEAGNRWIQFVPTVSELKNPDGSDNYSGIVIYHALPQSMNVDNDITNNIILYDLNDPTLNEEIKNLATSTSKGGYIKVQTSIYDVAGHLKSVEDKYFKLPDVDIIIDTANQAKDTADSAKGIADSAKGIAETAQGAAEAAQGTATGALTTANAASAAATAAEKATKTAEAAATAAKDSADKAAVDAKSAVDSVSALRGEDTTTTISGITQQLKNLEDYKSLSGSNILLNNSNISSMKTILENILQLIQDGKSDWSQVTDQEIENIQDEIEKIQTELQK